MLDFYKKKTTKSPHYYFYSFCVNKSKFEIK